MGSMRNTKTDHSNLWAKAGQFRETEPRWHVSIQGQGWEEKEMFDDFPTAAVVRGSCPFRGV